MGAQGSWPPGCPAYEIEGVLVGAGVGSLFSRLDEGVFVGDLPKNL
jgi:hypothetical protein